MYQTKNYLAFLSLLDAGILVPSVAVVRYSSWLITNNLGEKGINGL